MEKILTIAIPTYNRCTYLDSALHSIEKQYDSRIEVIVSDNASTDSTQEIVKRYRESLNLVYVKNAKNIGADANFLNCVRAATSRFVILLGDDDVIVEGALRHIVDYLEHNIGIALVFMNFVSFKEKYRGLEYCSVPWQPDSGDRAKLKKYDFMEYVDRQITFMSSLIINREKFSRLSNPEQYIGGYFIHADIALETTKNEEGNLGIITAPMIAKYSPSGEEDRALNKFFKVFGECMHKLLCIHAVESGYDKKQMNEIYKKYVNRAFISKILMFKARGIKNWKKDFWMYCYPVVKKYPGVWIKVIPILLVPQFLASYIVLYIKPIIKKYF